MIGNRNTTPMCKQPSITYVVYWLTATEDWRQFGARHGTLEAAQTEFHAVCRNPRCRAARILRCVETADVVEEMGGGGKNETRNDAEDYGSS